jgi:hypothetical protein
MISYKYFILMFCAPGAPRNRQAKNVAPYNAWTSGNPIAACWLPAANLVFFQPLIISDMLDCRRSSGFLPSFLPSFLRVVLLVLEQ